MNKQRVRMTAWCLGLILVAGSSLQTMASEDGRTYEEYRQGAQNTGEAREETRTEENLQVIEIATEEDLQWLAEQCRLDTWSEDKYIKLEADVLLKSDRNLCIPSFAGVFEGNGHCISGLQITDSGSERGLFRYVQQNGIVRNLSVEGSVVPKGSQSRVGGIAGVNYGLIRNCTFSGRVLGDCEVGGIAGVNEKAGEIRHCRSDAVLSGNHSTGGIVGSNHGILSHCSNEGEVNTHSMEVSYDLEDITRENLEDLNTTSNVSAHTDTGGVAGFSDGKMYFCKNEGNVGYPHVGYNVGGVAGRLHQGYLQNCTNSGQVQGRKDVGGIAGQMEPFLEIQYLSDKLQELDRESDKFLDLLDGAQKNLSAYGKQSSALAGNLSASLKNVSQAGEDLMGTAVDTWYLYNQELAGISEDWNAMNDRLEEQEKQDEENGSMHDVTISGNDIGIQLPDDRENYEEAFRQFGENTGNRMENLSAESLKDFEEARDSLDILNAEMEAACNYLEQLTDTLQEGTDQISEDMDALTAQARVLRGILSEIRDDLFGYEGITIEDASDEEVLYDTSSFRQGKITGCANTGRVEADTNIGGIAGTIAIEFDLDPEDDITVTGKESLDVEQTIRAVVRDSRNTGEITGKKDCVGGIVGKAEYGAVIACESYGGVVSTGGSYVGGIAGDSGYAIRSCYSMAELSGKDYVGGIAGEGCDIFNSYSYCSPKASGECRGSIAGRVEEEGTLYGNYYVDNGIGGIDGIGYAEGAMPLTYTELCSMEGVPKEFKEFTITFKADGEELALISCSYGEALDRALIPEIPEKEGYYGVWPEFDYDCVTGNWVIEAQYEKWISSLQSTLQDSKGRAKILVTGQFLPEDKLVADMDQDGRITLSIRRWEELYTDPVKVRVLCDRPEKMRVLILDGNGNEKEAETSVMGSYLVFDMEQPGTFCLTEDRDYSMLLVGGCIVGMAVIILLAAGMRKHQKRASKKAKRRAADAGEQKERAEQDGQSGEDDPV